MKRSLLSLTGIFLLTLPLQALPLSDSAGLTMELGIDGLVSGVSLNGISQPSGTGGGFYLQEPNSSTKVPLTGSVVTNAGQINLTLTNSLQARVTATLTQGAGFIEVEGLLEDLTGTDRGLWLGFNVPVNTLGWKWGHNLTAAEQVITGGAPGYSGENRFMIPIPAVWTTDTGGIALCIPPTNPCVFENGADAGGVRIRMAFGLSPITTNFPSKAPFRFRIYSIDGTWGFRDALAKYYDWYPDHYALEPAAMKRLNHRRDWLTMNYEDEGPGANDQASIASPELGEWCAYTKITARPSGMTGVETLPPTDTQGYLDAIAATTDIMHYQRKGAVNSQALIEARAAISNCVVYRPDGTWSMEMDPVAGELDIGHNVSPNLFKDAAHTNSPVYADMYLRRPGKLIGFEPKFTFMHWDRLGGRSAIVNYRREHFAYTAHPLTFDQLGRLCLPTQFSNYELFDAFRLQFKQGGMFHEGAGMKDFPAKQADEMSGGQDRVGLFFLSSVLAGAWTEGGEKYHALGEYDSFRIFMGRKSYRIACDDIPTMVAAGQTAEALAAVKRALANATAYGFASVVWDRYFYPTNHPLYNPATGSVFYSPEHQALWSKYIPASEAIRLAGWEPVTHAFANSSAVEVQRFGRGQDIYFTIWGPTNLPATVEIDIDAAALGLLPIVTASELILNNEPHTMTVVPSERGWKLTVSMETNMTRVIKITSVAALTSTFTESSIWTCPAGVNTVTAECWGGGGAGGAAFRNGSGSNSTGGGGAGGAYAKKVISGLIPGTNYTVTVGTGGVSVAGADDGTSAPGGDSWFNTVTTVLAKGGGGGIARNGVGLVGAGGEGSTAGSIGDLVNAGGSGSSGNGSSSGGGGGGSGGTAISGTNATGSTGAVAVSGGGPGGNGATTNADGSAPASGPGGGGGGARGPNAAKAGGAGNSGKVVLTFTAGSPAPLTYSAWSSQYNLVQGPDGDDDGDGNSNQFEFVAGLLPTDAASVFNTTAAPVPGQPDQVAIEFSPIVSGRTYTVKSSDSLASGSWTALVNPIVSEAGDVRTVVDTAATGERKFYVIGISVP